MRIDEIILNSRGMISYQNYRRDAPLPLRLPRPCLAFEMAPSIGGCLLASENIPSEPLAHDLADGDIETLPVIHLAVVEPEALFVQIPEQVEGFDANVRAVKATLYETPEVLQAVRVDLAVNVLDG